MADATRVTDDDYNWFVANPGVAVWEENGDVVGFSAADPRNGNIWALFVAPGFEQKGIVTLPPSFIQFLVRSSGFWLLLLVR
nr:GNAT family N-acetyltransferase [Rhizobium leguminosarum]